MTDTQLETFFLNNSDYFISNSIMGNVVRWIGWLILKGLVWIADQCQSLYDISFGLVDFTSWGTLNSYIRQFQPLFVVLMVVSLFALGILLITTHEKKPKFLINLCIACLCVTSSTVIFQQMNTIVQDIKTGIESVKVSGQPFDGVYDIVSNNLIDLLYMDQKVGMKNLNFSDPDQKIYHPQISEKNFWMIDYTEVMNYKSDYEFHKDGEAKTILQKKLVPLSEETGLDQYQIRNVYNGFGWNSDGDADAFNEFYFRYKFDFFLSYLELAAIIILYVAMSYKCVRVVWELAVSRLLATLYSAELSGGEKIGKILTFIRDSYILLLMTTLCIRFFYLFAAFIQSKTDNAFVQGVLILFVAFCVIDGPNLVEKLLGMDAGLKSSTARMMAAYTMAKGAVHTATAPARMAGNVLMQEHRASRWAQAAQQRAQSMEESPDGAGESVHPGAEGMGDATSEERQEHGMDDPAQQSEGGNLGAESGQGQHPDPQSDPDAYSFMQEDRSASEGDLSSTQTAGEHPAETAGSFSADPQGEETGSGHPMQNSTVQTDLEGSRPDRTRTGTSPSLTESKVNHQELIRDLKNGEDTNE